MFTGRNLLGLKYRNKCWLYKTKVLKKCKEKVSTEILNTKWKIKKPGNPTKLTKQDLMNNWFELGFVSF